MILLLLVLVAPLLVLGWMLRTVIREPGVAASAAVIGILLYLASHH